MAYIRPSASYLRSSFPATSLQDDPGLAWENMLTSHAKRSFSPFGFWRNEEEKQRQTINAEIDKQFWQNINSVRVSGAGATNYVIAKDDIGNWYVKSFSADPESIIKSAQQLAMFNLGGQMGTNLIRQRDLQRKVDSETATQDDKDELKELREQGRRGGNGTLKRVFDKHDKNYNEKTERDFNGLIQILDKKTIQKRISTSWEQNNDTKDPAFLSKFKNELNSADNNLESALADLKKDPGKTEQRGIKIIGALDAIRKFGVSLERQIIGLPLLEVPTRKLTAAKMKLQDANTPAKVATAKTEVEAAERELDLADRAQRVAIREATGIVRDELMKIATRRQDAVKDLETSVIFIGGAAKTPASDN